MIRLSNVSLRQGAFDLHSINLEAPDNCYAILMGPTGCGKTSLLEAICGLRPITGGSIHLGGREVTALKPARRGVGYVPQDGALFSTMTVRENLGFALRVRALCQRDVDERVGRIAGELGISHLLERLPVGLSGGEVQRVALGRALACEPAVLCLDEPLSALDADTRGQMYELLRQVQRQTGVTTLHVTHDQEEARRLGDCCFQFVQGRLVPVTPSASRAAAPGP